MGEWSDTYDYGEEYELDADGSRLPECWECGELLRWVRVRGKWTLYSLDDNTPHLCPARIADADEFPFE